MPTSTNIYQQLLSRDPESVGAAYWLGEVTAGRVTIAQLAVTVYNNALGRDALTVEARQQVADQFTSTLLANGTDYGGPAGVQAARLIVQAITNTTSPSEISALAAAGVTLAANATANPAIITGLTGANGHLVDLLGTTAGAASPLVLVNLLNNIITTAAGDATTLPTLLGTGTLVDALTKLPPGVTLTSVNTAITDGGLKDGWVELHPNDAGGGGGGGGGPAVPTFVVTQSLDGVITFSGTAAGDITMVDNHISITFMRGGITADNDGHGFFLGNSSKITLAADQKISATADAVNGATIEGLGSVAITDLKLYSDLSKITTDTVTAAVTTKADTLFQLFENAKLGKAVVTVSGDGVFDLHTGVVGAASFIVEAGATLKGSGFPSSSGPNLVDQLSGATITGPGKVDITNVQSATDFSKIATGLTVKASIADSSGAVGVSDEAARAVDEFAVGAHSNLQLTALQAVGKTINGAGSTTVSGSDGAQTLKVETTGTNTITGGKGGDAITLGIGMLAFPGTDTIKVAGGTAATTAVKQLDTLALSGVYEVGDKLTVKGIATADVVYTVIADDLIGDAAADLVAVAAKLVTAINGAAGATVAATATSAGALTIEAKVAGTPFTAIAEATNAVVTDTQAANIQITTPNQAGSADTQVAAIDATDFSTKAPAPGIAQVSVLRLTGDYEVGDKIEIAGITTSGAAVSYTVVADDIQSTMAATISAIATNLGLAVRMTQDKLVTTVAWSTNGVQLTEKATSGAGFTAVPTTINADAVAKAQVSTLTLAGDYDIGDTVTVTINSTDVAYTVIADDIKVAPADTLAAIATKVVTALSANTTVNDAVSALVTSGGALTLTAKTAGTGFTATAVATNVVLDNTQLISSTLTTPNNTGGAGIDAESYWSDAGGTYDTITNFGVGPLAIQKDKLQLDVAGVFANGSYTVGAITVSVNNGMATVSSASGVGDALSAIATAMGTAKTTAAYVVGNDTYILQNDGVAGLSNADVVIKLVGSGVNNVTNLADILAGPV